MAYLRNTGDDTDIESPPAGVGMINEVVRGHYTDEHGFTMLVLGIADKEGTERVLDGGDIFLGIMFGKTYYVTAHSLSVAGFKLSKYFDEEGNLHDAR